MTFRKSMYSQTLNAIRLNLDLCSVPRFFRELFPFGFVVKREAMARC